MNLAQPNCRSSLTCLITNLPMSFSVVSAGGDGDVGGVIVWLLGGRV